MSYFISHEQEVSRYPNSLHYEFYHASVKSGTWKNASGNTLFYASVIKENAKACVVISPGRAETVIKYAELIYELYQNGYSVFIFDHQGQGASSRLLPNPHIGYVKSFSHYTDDMAVLIDKVLNPLLTQAQQGSLDKLLLCHSMGAAIGALFLIEHPSVFSKAVLCAPMVGIKAPMPEWFVNGLVLFVLGVRKIFRLPERYFFGQTDYQAYPFYKNRLTSSEVRYDVFRKVMALQANVQLGGIGFTWLAQAIVAMRKIRHQASSILLPCLVLKAEQDKIVDNHSIEQLAQTIASAKLIRIPHSEHEILFEQDEARGLALTEILQFFEAQE